MNRAHGFLLVGGAAVMILALAACDDGGGSSSGASNSQDSATPENGADAGTIANGADSAMPQGGSDAGGVHPAADGGGPPLTDGGGPAADEGAPSAPPGLGCHGTPCPDCRWLEDTEHGDMVLEMGSDGSTHDMHDIWASGPSNVWAVGNEGTIHHYDGARWSLVPSSTGLHLQSIFGYSPDDIWVVGGFIGDQGGILHYDGSEWQTIEVDDPDGPNRNILWSVWGAPDKVWIVGAKGMYSYDGSSWERIPCGRNGKRIIVAFEGDDVWAFGGGPLAAHWDGSTCTEIQAGEAGWPAPQGGEEVGIMGAFACGPDDILVTLAGRLPAMHYDGTTWAPLPVSGNSPAIWVNGPEDIWFGLNHWDGQAGETTYDGGPSNGALTGGVSRMWGSAGDDIWTINLLSEIAHYSPAP